jgi:hypothetical protein
VCKRPAIASEKKESLETEMETLYSEREYLISGMASLQRLYQ